MVEHTIGIFDYLTGALVLAARKTMNWFIFCKAPESAEPSRNMAVPIIKNHLRPNWSESSRQEES